MMLVKIQDIYLNPEHVVAVEESAIVGVTRITVSYGQTRREYQTHLSPAVVVELLKQRRSA